MASLAFLYRSKLIIEKNGGEVSIETAITALLSLIFISHFVYLYNKFAIVEISDKGIKIQNGGITRQVNWEKVESIDDYGVFKLPFYKVRVLNEKHYVIFGSYAKYFSINGERIPMEMMSKFLHRKQ